MAEPTPMLRQYLELKKQYPGTILLFRLGDFYEMFNDDAIAGSKALDITLTARQKSSGNPVPMCGVPHHAAANYIAKLVRKGFRVAICEQTEKASPTKKLVRREVVRVITPGTAIDEQLLESDVPVYLASLSGSGGTYGLAYLDLSTGEFAMLECTGAGAWESVVADLETIAPRELLFPSSLKPLVETRFGNSQINEDVKQSNLYETDIALDSTSTTLTQLDDSEYDTRFAEKVLSKQFGTRDLSGFGLKEKREGIRAAGVCLNYALRTRMAAGNHITELKLIETANHMVLDALTIANLELIKDASNSPKKSLFGIINETVTPMGARTLRSWLLRPSVRIGEIEARKRSVSEFTDDMLRDQVRFYLKKVSDLERLVGRVSMGTANPRDLAAIGATLAELPTLRSLLDECESPLLNILAENMAEHRAIHDLIESAIDEDPPVGTADGGFIKEGFDEELDKFRDIAKDTKRSIAGFEQTARKETGIGSLHVKFNNIFGYFIEISKSNLSKAPAHYERRQTLTNSERFTTPELKEWEAGVLGAEEKIKAIELALFKTLTATILRETRSLQKTAGALATLDVLASLGENAVKRGYLEPVLHEGDELFIKNGRHAVVEAVTGEPFIPNDLLMNNSTDRLLIITGANMGGKSTLLRQIALIQILAQIGSFVPASEARISLCDRIWTRVGASDDLASGRSTFMVEMTETATILHNASARSLILLDEIGRGTSTFDGLAIAWAVAEYLHDSPDHSAKTLFATHYHELTELAEKLPGAKNYQISAKEVGDKVVFLHKLKPGAASQSYGIAVAKLAGLPIETVERAKEVLRILEKYELAVFEENMTATAQKGLGVAAARAATTQKVSQVSLFAISNEALIEELRNTDIEALSETEALDLVRRLKKRLI